MLLVIFKLGVFAIIYTGAYGFSMYILRYECGRKAAGDGTNQENIKEIMGWKEKESIGKVSVVFVS